MLRLQLACRDGLSLLHRAVLSGCGATLEAVLGWGEEDAGQPWCCDRAGALPPPPPPPLGEGAGGGLRELPERLGVWGRRRFSSTRALV